MLSKEFLRFFILNCYLLLELSFNVSSQGLKVILKRARGYYLIRGLDYRLSVEEVLKALQSLLHVGYLLATLVKSSLNHHEVGYPIASPQLLRLSITLELLLRALIVFILLFRHHIHRVPPLR
jgi:hypothetical protein